MISISAPARSRSSAARSHSETPLPQETKVKSRPVRSFLAVPTGMNCFWTSADVPRETSFSIALGYKNTVGRNERKAAFNIPAASQALDGMRTSKPGL